MTFVQLNTTSPQAQRRPIGYCIGNNGCWEWVGGKVTGGYGRLSVNGKMVYAHRWMYERHNGPIPVGLELDHLCRNRGCVNPAHLEAVTHKENCLRGISPVAYHRKKTHCPRGHELTRDNLRAYELRMGRRVFRACKNDWMRKRAARKRNAA